jgi:glycosyltransferase involved in cell wall biosynthesis
MDSDGGLDAPRLALLHDLSAAGAGGTDLLCFMLASLASVSPETTWDILLPSANSKRSSAALAKRCIMRLAGLKVPAHSHDSKHMDAIRSCGAPVTIIECAGAASDLATAMRECHANSLFFCRKPLGRLFPLPWIGYIADLQHRRLPHFFKSVERWHRDRVMANMLSQAPGVVVNAAAVARDIEDFFPNRKARLFALPFCPPADRGRLSNPSDPGVRAAYGLPRRYFIVSNQFWIHKSHETAFRALRMVRDAGHDVSLVCTGETTDYRWPEHFRSLQALIEKLELQDSIRILGLIPKADQLAIMRGSVAVIQPTLFEGGPGGGSVYDAVSTGTPAIVSDIPVNREIDLGVTCFFTAGSPEGLAEKMIGWMVDPPRKPSEEESLAQLTARQRELGFLLLNIARVVASGSSAALRPT